MQELNETKFRELILYCANQCEKDPHFGATWLNKCLFFSDFVAFKALGSPITGAEYEALEYGPVPTPLVDIRDMMVREGDIAIDQRRRQRRVVPLRDADLSQFSSKEIDLVNTVIQALRPHNANQVSEISHLFLGWKAARAEAVDTGRDVVIPYSTVFVFNEPVDQFVQAHGLEKAAKYDWPI